MRYDPKSGLVYGIGLRVLGNGTNDWERTLVSLDGRTGNFTVVASIPGYFIILSSICAIDHVQRRLWAILQRGHDGAAPFDLVSVNLDTGKILTHPQLCTNDIMCPWTLEYQP